MPLSISRMMETALLEVDEPITLSVREDKGKISYTVETYPYSFTRKTLLEAYRDLYRKVVTGLEY